MMTPTNSIQGITQPIINYGDTPVPIVIKKTVWVWYLVFALHMLLGLMLFVGDLFKQPIPKPVLEQQPAIQAELWQALPSTQLAAPIPKSIVMPKVVQFQALPSKPSKEVISVHKPLKVKSEKNTEKSVSSVASKMVSKTVLKPVNQLPITKKEVLPIKSPAKSAATESVSSLKARTEKQIEKNNAKKVVDKPTESTKNEPTKKNVADSEEDAIAAVVAKEAAHAKRVERMKTLASFNEAAAVGRPQTAGVKDLGAGWGAKLKQCVQPNLRYNDTTGSNPRVEFLVKLTASGSPSSLVLTKSSGNSTYDVAVERALRRCDPFPKPASGEYPLSIRVGYSLNN
jgi:colicin import membrane protein